MLRPYTGPLNRLDFCTYDLEWYPDTYKLRLVGVYDGESYRSYTTIAAFLDEELTREARGRIFFAHAGGLADVQFVLEEILKKNDPSIHVEASFSGSSAIIVRIEQHDHKWVFCDSYWLFRDSLARIGEALGQSKGGDDYRCPDWPACGHKIDPNDRDLHKCIFFAPLGILTDYNALDNKILYDAIRGFEVELLELGGSLRPTIASTAMRLFRARYLQRPIRTHVVINRWGREAYHASRVEVFMRRVQGPAKHYDFNSSFPYSMTFDCPGALLGQDRSWDEYDDLSMVRAIVTSPKVDVPPIPHRSPEGRVFFPYGTWEAWFSGVDLQLLLEAGGTIERVKRVCHFERRDDLRAYVEEIYSRRMNAPEGSFRRLLLKYLLNSLYGKFGETTEKEAMLIHPKVRPLGIEPIAHGIYLVPQTARVEHEHVPFALTITARSRALLTRQIWKAGSRIYSDTDSLITKTSLETSPELGGLKEEKGVERDAVFLAPKLYRLDDRIRAKGFPKLTRKEFDALENGGSIRLNRMLRLRELYRLGETTPRAATDRHGRPGVDKRLRGVVIPKRREESDGDTSPWSIDELESMAKEAR